VEHVAALNHQAEICLRAVESPTPAAQAPLFLATSKNLQTFFNVMFKPLIHHIYLRTTAAYTSHILNAL
jgi:hypothetical protein